MPDFAAGAMENTAAIFYREVDLLADSKTASVENAAADLGGPRARNGASVVRRSRHHEMVGRPVAERRICHLDGKRPLAALKPEWRMDVEAVLDTQRGDGISIRWAQRAPFTPRWKRPLKSRRSFDAIAYEKGASVMRMIEGYLGPEVFRNGVNAYIDQHAYGNATSADFWTAMTKVSGKPIDRILPTFVNQPGVPVVGVTLRCDASPQLAVTSERFFTDTAMAKVVRTKPSWETPLCTKTPLPRRGLSGRRSAGNRSS